MGKIKIIVDEKAKNDKPIEKVILKKKKKKQIEKKNSFDTNVVECDKVSKKRSQKVNNSNERSGNEGEKKFGRWNALKKVNENLEKLKKNKPQKTKSSSLGRHISKTKKKLVNNINKECNSELNINSSSDDFDSDDDADHDKQVSSYASSIYGGTKSADEKSHGRQQNEQDEQSEEKIQDKSGQSDDSLDDDKVEMTEYNDANAEEDGDDKMSGDDDDAENDDSDGEEDRAGDDNNEDDDDDDDTSDDSGDEQEQEDVRVVKSMTDDFGFGEAEDAVESDSDEHDEEEEMEAQVKEQRKQRQVRDPSEDERTVFVGNVHLKTKKKALLKVFKEYGAVESIRYRNLPVRSADKYRVRQIRSGQMNTRRSTMTAYVKFATPAAAAQALAANMTEVRGCHLVVNSCSGKTSKQLRHTTPHGTSVFVGNLPFNVEEEEVLRCFKKAGDVLAVNVLRHRTQGRGAAFVVFQDVSSATAVVAAGATLRGRRLRVTKVVKKQRDAAGPSRPHHSKQVQVTKGAEMRIFKRNNPEADMKNMKNVKTGSNATTLNVRHNNGPNHAGPNHAGPSHAGPNHAGPNHAGRQHDGWKHAGPNHAGRNYAGPNNAGPNHAGPNHAGPNHAGPNNVGPKHVGQKHAGPKNGPRNVGPNNAGPKSAGPDSTGTSSKGSWTGEKFDTKKVGGGGGSSKWKSRGDRKKLYIAKKLRHFQHTATATTNTAQ